MKVLFVLSSAKNVIGGGSKAFLNLLDGLTERGVAVFVVFPEDGALCQQVEDRGGKTMVCNYRSSTFPSYSSAVRMASFLPRLAAKLIVNFFASGKIARFAKENRVDLIHTNVSIIDVGYKAAKRLSIPHVWHIREYAEDLGYMRIWSRRQFEGALRADSSYSVCITKGVERYYHLTDVEASRVIYDGVLGRYDICGSLNKEGYILYAGALNPRKGVYDLLLAFSDFKKRSRSPLRLKIAGETDDAKYLDFLISESQALNVSGDVDFLGRVYNVSELMSKAHAVVVPSYSEGFGFVMAEAMFNGSLVIGRNTTGTKEQFDNGYALTGDEIGLRYETQEELVGILCRIDSDGVDAYGDMVRRARFVVQSLYTVEQHVGAVYEFYERILRKDSRSI